MMELNPQAQDELDSLHPMEKKIILILTGDKATSDETLHEETDLDEGQLRRALGWLKTKEIITIMSEKLDQFVSLTERGEQFADKGTPEVRIASELQAGKQIHMKDVKNQPDFDPEEISKAVGNLKKSNVLTVERGFLKIVDFQALAHFNATQDLLRQLAGGSKVSFQELTSAQQEIVNKGFRKRGKSKGTFWIDDQVTRTYGLTEKGQKIKKLLHILDIPLEEIGQLTPAHLKDHTWKGKSFRKYTITMPSPRLIVGRKHPYREFLDRLKIKLIGMGFAEMKGNIVENEFWNMDALFMPQFHSARDIHDVYFLKKPLKAQELEEPFARAVAQCHENGAETGSSGWGYQFARERSRRLILRSQGTVLSARTLASKPNIPGKYFAIARCFRYDNIDATHAPDFFQIEGIVLGKDINFRHLLGLLKLFAEEVARAKEVKYLPAYFPFTEPSVEVHIKHEQLGWMEMGGAGLFRPEVTRPLGVDVPVIAWGLGVDRMAMVALGIQDIRNLFSTDLDLIRSKICHL
ncbi:phenylalanine--tRNA ligase subunit alpha [candidate division CSSED10-310 bacterium]|uniref:phenylalanine--tRNA ligase n=1 Tax=candidate division CSSED10-310 bacterium TaxID=2855610 RepID=A0ABV6YX92_UNCC1